MDRSDPRFVVVNEPFETGRDNFRLVFDFAAMLSCFSRDLPNRRVLDFCAGTCWVSEWLNRAGYDVHAIDINADVENVLKLRIQHDLRLDPARLSFRHADGHKLPFEDAFFGHICSFDSLHHMKDYRKALAEMFRVLTHGGRAIFIEPGAKHSTSPETQEFIRKYKSDDPDWIERDVILDEIQAIGSECGFSHLKVKPLLLPNLREYPFGTWKRFREGDRNLEADYLDLLKAFNYDSHLVFYLEKPHTLGQAVKGFLGLT